MDSHEQLSLFGGPSDDLKPPARVPTEMRVMVTVTAAPNPSATHGETVCVAGIRIDIGHEGWIRLYPVNLRHLGDGRFHKYDVLDVRVAPQHKHDQRLESWAPRLDSIQVAGSVRGWHRRLEHLRPHIRKDMCAVLADAKADPTAPSLALIKPERILGLDIEAHPGWTVDEAAKIDAYANQLDLFGEDRRPLEAPRFKAWYRYACGNPACGTHRQGIIDWEFVAHQRHLNGSPDDEVREALRLRWLDEICSDLNSVAFYVGNQAKRRHVFSVLGVVYPRRSANLI